MAIYKRPDSPYWWMDIRLPNGKRVQKSTGEKGKMAAKKVYNEFVSVEGKHRLAIIQCKITFEEYSQKYLGYYKANRKESAFKRCELSLRNFKSYLYNKYSNRIDLDQVTSTDIENYKTERLSVGTAKRTINNELANIKNLFSRAYQVDEIISRDPAKKVKKFTIEERQPRFFTKEEITGILDTASDYTKGKYLIPVIVALETGMRLGEVVRLTVGDIDLPKRIINVTATKSGKDRIVYINDGLARSLAAYFSDHFGDTIPIPTARLFDIQIEQTSRIFGKILKVLYIENASFHTLRHTFASYWVMDGKDIVTLSEILGHYTINTTMIYAHLSPEHIKKEMLKFGVLAS